MQEGKRVIWLIAGITLIFFGPNVNTQADPGNSPDQKSEAGPKSDSENTSTDNGAEASWIYGWEEKDDRPVIYRSVPLYTGSIRAPQPGSSEAVSPWDWNRRRGLLDALTRPIEFGQPSLGFEPPDWTEPLRDIEADSMETDLTTGRTVLKQNVRLRLGSMLFRSGQFAYDKERGDYEASAGVIVEQSSSRLTAERLQYILPDEETLQSRFVLIPVDDEEFNRMRLRMGRLIGENVEVTEPTRSFRAERVDYDFATRSGELINARGNASIFYYHVGKLHIKGPDDMSAEDLWLTTCPDDDPHYRILMKELVIENSQVVSGKAARLQLGKVKTPLFLPFWKNGDGPYPWSASFNTGRYAEIGTYADLGIQFQVSPELSLGPRLLPTDKGGIGFGGDLYYDYMNSPVSPLYRTSGSVHGLETTDRRGYLEWYHWWEPNRDLVLRGQVEQWSDETFYKDYFYDSYRHRSTPRTFADLTWRTDDFITGTTAQVHTHGWTPETEKLPEAYFSLPDRPLLERVYASFDAFTGYYDQNLTGANGARTLGVGRVSFDLDPLPGLAVTPFYEVEGAWYQRDRFGEESADRVSNQIGITAQSRFSRKFPGFGGFSAFKHVILPSLTVSWRPSPTLDFAETPQFDALDYIYGRHRIESKLTNLFYARDAETGYVWQAARLTLYQGNDLWNEIRKSGDYQIELDVRPRPNWGSQFVGERHLVDDDRKPLTGGWREIAERDFYLWYEDRYGFPYNDRSREVTALFTDYNRVLTQVYYDDIPQGGRFRSRVGFMYTDSEGRIFNRDILYGAGFRIDDNWAVGFEHIYDLSEGDLRQQLYEIRRRIHCGLETALRFRDRRSGFDVNFELGLATFGGPTTSSEKKQEDKSDTP
ncbi:MAG TPA: hypothetical protein PLO53_01720 [Candidatus Hydrogenedentes bacterium]|nr:hypothetical protein [Candidatus Hydrogenedentota bacterium]